MCVVSSHYIVHENSYLRAGAGNLPAPALKEASSFQGHPTLCWILVVAIRVGGGCWGGFPGTYSSQGRIIDSEFVHKYLVTRAAARYSGAETSGNAATLR